MNLDGKYCISVLIPEGTVNNPKVVQFLFLNTLTESPDMSDFELNT